MKNYKGFTLVELMVTVLIASIVMLGLGAVLADGHRGYNQMYNRINSDVVVDSYGARRAFDAIIRKASAGSEVITPSSAKVYYFSGPGLSSPDRYALFKIDNNGQLIVDEGTYSPSSETLTSSRVIAKNVKIDDSTFEQKRACIQMILHLNNNKEDMVITCSSIRHNR